MSASRLNPLRDANHLSLRKPPSEEILRDFSRLLSLVTDRFKPNDIPAPAPEKALIFTDAEPKPLSILSSNLHLAATRIGPEASL